MTFAELKVKDWKAEQEQRKACNYGADGFDWEKNEDGTYTVVAEILKETEKAVFVDIAYAYKCWLPKSTVEFVKVEEVA